jgi:hypothetical protein
MHPIATVLLILSSSECNQQINDRTSIGCCVIYIARIGGAVLMADDGRRRNVSMDFSVSIPSAAAASMLVDKENTSDDRISIIIPHSRSPSSKILPLGFQRNEAPSDHSPARPVSAKRVALALTKKVII